MKPDEVAWKDMTRARGQSGQEWGIRVGDLYVSIHHHIHYPPMMWFVSCHEVGMERVEIGEVSVQEAMAAGLCKVHERLTKLIRDAKLAHSAPLPKEQG